MMDVDYFKQINDRHGHLTGDSILQIFTRLIQTQIRQDDILARYGGDEFVLIMPNTPTQHAQTTLERIRARIETHEWPVEGITSSLGYTTWTPSQGDIPSGLLANEILLEADLALYQAKQSGRNAVRRYIPGKIRP